MIAYRRVVLLVMLLAAVAAPAGAMDVEKGLRRLLASNGPKQGRVSVMVMDLDRGEVLAAIDADEPMIPASNMKLLTTAAAQSVLGPDFVFRTELGLIETGDVTRPPILLIKADGDPAFGDPVLLEQHGLTVDHLLDHWIDAVRGTGIKAFARLMIDDRVFDRQLVHASWPSEQLHKRYCAQVAGLNFHRNCVDVTLIPADRAGQTPAIERFPDGPFITTTNLITTGRTDTFSITRKPGTNDLTFRGSIRNRASEPWQVTMHDPAMVFAKLLRHRLKQEGIEVRAVERIAADTDAPPAETLHAMRTTLPLVLTRTNQDSQNMFAEALFKRIGHKVTGAPGSWENGAAAMRIFLRKRLGPRSSAAVIADGSGLSRDNRVTARLIVELLRAMHEDPGVGELYRDSLAYGGRTHEGRYLVSGTFARNHRFDGLPPGHWVFGKSGYIRGVSALSGYLILPDADGQGHRTIAFSFLFNGFKNRNHEIKKLQDKMVELIDTAASDPVRLGG